MIIHIIQEGETLTTVAKKYNVNVPDVKKANPQVIDDNMVTAGMKLLLPRTSKKIQQNQAKHITKEEQAKSTQENSEESRRPIGYIQHDDLTYEKKTKGQTINIPINHPISRPVYPHQVTNGLHHTSTSLQNSEPIEPTLYCDGCHQAMKIKK